MHELAVCRALIAQVEQQAAAHRAIRVRRVFVQIGPLSGVDPDLLQNAYPIACEGTTAQDSRLEIERMALRVHCPSCGEETQATVNRLACGACGHWKTQVVGGDEMLLSSVELEKPADDATEEETTPCATPAAAT